MNPPSPRNSGIDVRTLSSEMLEVAVVPELGGKILSLRDRLSGREWLWAAPDGRGLFRNAPGDAFEDGPLAGIDDCTPTVLPCEWEGRRLPDHGEVWMTPATCRVDAGMLSTSVRLPVSPLVLHRDISFIAPNTMELVYRMENTGDKAEHFLWAWHPLFPHEPGDTIEFPVNHGDPGTESAVSDLLEGSGTGMIKCFLPAPHGRCALRRSDGSMLEIRWDANSLPWLGIWVTRGAWHGFTHIALEPTNAPLDSLAERTLPHRDEAKFPPPLAPGASRTWRLLVTVQ